MTQFRGRPRFYHKWSDEERKAYHRKAHLWQSYKMMPEEYEEILGWQDGKCAICGGVNPSGKRLAVDHDHATGQTRNLLCSSCNKGLGLFKDNPEFLENALLYLKAWKENWSVEKCLGMKFPENLNQEPSTLEVSPDQKSEVEIKC